MTRMSRSTGFASLVVLPVLAAFTGGCEVGDGVGAARGSLFVYDCSPEKGTRGEPTAPAPYDMQPTFFAGEPIDDARVGGRDNRIVIRLETAGRRVRRSKTVTPTGPVKDTLYLDVDNYETALCVRAAATGGVTPDPSTCQIVMTPEGPRARTRVGPEQPIRVSFAPRAECYKNIYVVGAGVGDDPMLADVRQPLPPEQWPSFVDWKDFGAAASGDPRPEFKVEFGETLSATNFQIQLEDDRVIKAIKREDLPDPSELKGTLTGYFDFDLQRGQGAQTFP